MQDMQDFNGYVPQGIRKRLITLLVFVLCAVFIAGCAANGGENNGEELTYTPDVTTEVEADATEPAENGTETTNEAPPADPMADIVTTAEVVTEDNILEFVTLGQYIGLTFDRVPFFEVLDEDVEDWISGHLARATVIEITDRAVINGDIVTIDFEGFHDGVPFDGGAAQGFDLIIGSGRFIPGFEEQIIGHNIGDEFDINVSFPDDYFMPDLAGEAVIFRIKIHAIMSEVIPELTDELVREQLGIDTLEEYTAMVREQMESERAGIAASQERGIVWDQIMQGATVHKYPENEINARFDMAMQEIEFYAAMQNVELEELVELAIGISLEEFVETQIKPGIIAEVGQDLVLRAIAAQEGISITDEEFYEGVRGFIENFNFPGDEGEFIEMHGELTIRIALLADIVIDFIMENSVAN